MHLISVTTNRDLLVPVAAGTAGFDLPEVVDSIPLHHLRYVDGGVVDASSITRFFIDEGGQKHVVHVDGWEQLDCGIDDQLTRTKAGWRVWTEEDQEVLVELRAGRRGLGVVGEEPRQVHHAGHPGDHRQDMKPAGQIIVVHEVPIDRSGRL